MINPSPCIDCQLEGRDRRDKIRAAKAKDSDFDRFKKTVVRATKKTTERGR